jgi:hypothetical protein
MSDNNTAEENVNIQDEENEELIRQDYCVRVSKGREVVIPNALEGEELFLAETRKPDFAKAVNMPAGVRSFFLLQLSI